MQTDRATIFADIAQKFGLSRAAGQAFCAIWSAEAPLSAEDLVVRAALSRTSVSVALKELRAWGLITPLRLAGARVDRFAAPQDPWALVAQMLAERQRRDIAPLAARLRALKDPRSADLAEVFEAGAGWLAALSALPPADLAEAMQPARGEDKKKKKKKG